MADEDVFEGQTEEIITDDWSGQPIIHSGIETVSFYTTERNIRTFTRGEAVRKEVIPNFAGGDMAVPIAEGELVTEMIILKPDELKPENIAEGQYIAGVGPGTHVGGSSGEADFYISYMSIDGSEILYQKPIMYGDTAGDVVALGLMDEPIIPNTEENEYTFLGWSDSVGGEAKTAMFDTVTENRTVYAVYNVVSVVASGDCGESAKWKLWDNGLFVVSGTGAMTDYALPVDRPWVDYISQIKEVVIESGITTIGNRAFVLCENMTRVTIPDGITRIGIRAFIACYALEAAIIPDGVTYIGDYAFYECRSMTELVLPDSITEIGMQSFRLCTSLPSVTVPPKLTVLPRSSFYDCDSLTSFVVPDQVTTIGPYAIYNCDKLEELTFGKSVASIDYYAVYRSYSLKKITFTGNAPTISSADVFGEVTATVYYPANDATWTAAKRQNYGGTLTWVAY